MASRTTLVHSLTYKRIDLPLSPQLSFAQTPLDRDTSLNSSRHGYHFKREEALHHGRDRCRLRARPQETVRKLGDQERSVPH